MIEIAICDDEEKDAAIINSYVKAHLNKEKLDYTICIYRTGEELLDSNRYFHIVFLDIAMGRGMTGIRAGREFRNGNRSTKIIYTTSFRQYFEQALNDVHAFAYLQKPIQKEALILQLKEVLRFIKVESEFIYVNTIEITMNPNLNAAKRKIDINAIYYFEYINRKIKIQTKDTQYWICGQMKNIIDDMQEHSFEECHQNFLVNLAYVDRVKAYELYLKNGKKIPISQRKSAEFREKLNSYLQRSMWEK